MNAGGACSGMSPDNVLELTFATFPLECAKQAARNQSVSGGHVDALSDTRTTRGFR